MIGFDCAIWLRDTRCSEAPELGRVTILDRVENLHIKVPKMSFVSGRNNQPMNR
jgi:hypothetical protein